MHGDARAPRVGEKAPEPELADEAGRRSSFSSVGGGRPLVVIVFRGPRDAAGLSLLRAYRDDTLAFWRAGARICALGPGEPAEMRWLRRERGFAFPLLSARGPGALAAAGFPAGNPVLLLDGDGVVRHRGSGDAATPEVLLSIVRRGGARRSRPSIGNRLAGLGHAVQHAFRALRPAR